MPCLGRSTGPSEPSAAHTELAADAPAAVRRLHALADGRLGVEHEIVGQGSSAEETVELLVTALPAGRAAAAAGWGRSRCEIQGWKRHDPNGHFAWRIADVSRIPAVEANYGLIRCNW